MYFLRNGGQSADDRDFTVCIISPVANMTHLVFLYKVFFGTVSKSLLVVIPNPIAARPKRLSVFLKIDKFKMATW